MKKRIIAILMCLCLCLSACGGEDTSETTSESEHAASVDNGTLQDDSVALSVGKTTVPYREYKVYYYFMKNQYEDVFSSDVWNYKAASAEGKSIGQEAIEDVLRLIIQVKVVCKAAAMQGVTLAADEKEDADYSAKKYVEGLSEAVRKENGIDTAVMSQIFEENKLAQKMYNVVIGKVDVNISEEQAKAARVQLLYLKKDSSNQVQVKQKADELYKQVKSSGSSFYTVAKANTQGEEIEYLIGKLDSRTNLVNAVFALKEYGISNVIEENDGYYIAYCVSESKKKLNEEYKNEVVEERQTAAFQAAYKEWSNQYEVKVSRSLLVK